MLCAVENNAKKHLRIRHCELEGRGNLIFESDCFVPRI